MKRVEDILANVGEVQAIPETAISLIRTINNPNSTIDDIVDHIKYDQVLTARVLRLCNSALFGVAHEVTSLNDAICLLGTIKILHLVLTIHSTSLLSKEQKGYDLAPGMLWRHSVGVATASSLFAERTKSAPANLAFTAGLLHDIGKVLLSQYVAEEFNEILRLVADDQTSFATAEKEVLGFSHEEIGAKLAEKWELPKSIVNPIRYHHHPLDLPEPDPLVDMVHLGDAICLLLGVGLGTDGLSYDCNQEVMKRHDLYGADMELIGAQMLTDLKRIELLLSNKH